MYRRDRRLPSFSVSLLLARRVAGRYRLISTSKRVATSLPRTLIFLSLSLSLFFGAHTRTHTNSRARRREFFPRQSTASAARTLERKVLNKLANYEFASERAPARDPAAGFVSCHRRSLTRQHRVPLPVKNAIKAGSISRRDSAPIHTRARACTRVYMYTALCKSTLLRRSARCRIKSQSTRRCWSVLAALCAV